MDGSVTREWARHHHPNWYQALIDDGQVAPEAEEETEAPKSDS